MSKNSDWEFIFDGVFGYLSSPLWTVPIMSFIESESIVFEATEENHLAWTEVHNKYKQLVESLLGSYLSDVGITEEQFMRACVSSSAQKVPGLQNVLEQLYAADRFEIFKRMMVQRNLELQLEALEMIQKRQGVQSDRVSQSATRLPSEDDILQEVLRQSEIEYQESQQRLLEKASSSSPTKISTSSPPPTYDAKLEAQIVQQDYQTKKLEQQVWEKQEETKHTVNEILQNESNQETAEPSPPCTKPSSPTKANSSTEKEEVPKLELESKRSITKKPSVVLAPLRNTPHQEVEPTVSITPASPSKTAAEDWVDSARKENESTPKTATQSTTQSSNDKMTSDEIKQRTEYLKQQRDRLLALKKTEREKQLKEYTKSQPERPKSARVAAQSMSGNTTAVSKEDEKKMKMRRALAEKLKKEVVYR